MLEHLVEEMSYDVRFRHAMRFYHFYGISPSHGRHFDRVRPDYGAYSFDTSRLLSILLGLELKGAIKKIHGNFFKKS